MHIVAADRELTDAEILDRFGDLFSEAVAAFRVDPSYIVTMGEAAGRWKGTAAGSTPPRPIPTMPPRVIPSLAQQVVRLRQDGFPVPAVAQELGITETTVKRLSKQQGYQGRKPNPQLTPVERAERDRRIAEHFGACGNVSWTAKKFDLSRRAVTVILRRNSRR